MNSRPDRVPARIQDILDSIGNVRADLGGMSKAEFLSDGKTQRAVIESLIVIGEAANKITQLTPALKESQPVLWQQFRDAYDMRIVLTHEYFRVDAAIVWTTVREHLPTLEAHLTAYKTNTGQAPSSAL